MFLIMGNEGFISSTVVQALRFCVRVWGVGGWAFVVFWGVPVCYGSNRVDAVRPLDT